MRGRFESDAAPLALVTALLWTLHPLQTESVTYVVQRVESLMGLFYLLTIYCFIRSVETATPLYWRIFTVISCLVGMATKEVMVTAPLLVLLYDRTFVAGTFRDAWKEHWGIDLCLAATWLPLAWLVAGTGGSRHGSAGFIGAITPNSYWLTQFEALTHYLRLSIWPHPLVFDYGPFLVHGLVEVLPYALLVIILVGLTAIALWRWPMVGFVGVWFFGILAPTSIVPVATQTMAEHRMYLPLAAVILGVVLAFHRLAGTGWKAWISLGVLAFGLATMTSGRNSVYATDVSLWSATARDWPQNPRAHCSLGLALSTQPGGLAHAINEYREAIRLHENYADAHTDLGIALQQTPGNLEPAISEFERAVQIRPSSAEAHNDLGLALEQAGRSTGARDQLEEAIRIRPSYPEAECNLGILLLKLGAPAQAQAHLERAFQLDPTNARAEFFLAGVLGQEGRKEESVEKLRDVIRLRDDFAEAHSTLGMMLFTSGSTSEGMAEIEKAIRLQPDLEQAHLLRAAALLQLGRSVEGRQELQLILQIYPGNQAATQMLRALNGFP